MSRISTARSSTSSSPRRSPTIPSSPRKLEEVCPVDIFKATDAGTEVVRENLDECVLCELCLEAAPPGTVVVKKLYDGTELRRG